MSESTNRAAYAERTAQRVRYCGKRGASIFSGPPSRTSPDPLIAYYINDVAAVHGLDYELITSTDGWWGIRLHDPAAPLDWKEGSYYFWRIPRGGAWSG